MGDKNRVWREGDRLINPRDKHPRKTVMLNGRLAGDRPINIIGNLKATGNAHCFHEWVNIDMP